MIVVRKKAPVPKEQVLYLACIYAMDVWTLPTHPFFCFSCRAG